MIDARPIARVGRPRLDEFRALLRAGEPVVLTDVVRDWPAFGKWSIERLVEVHGDVRIEVRARHGGAPQVFAGDPLAAFGRESITVRALIENARSLRESSRYYLQYCDLRATLPAFGADVRDPPYLPRWLCSHAMFWVCGAETVNPLHYDFNHVLMAQLVGRKQFLLYPPRDSAHIAGAVDRFVWRTTAFDPWSEGGARAFPQAASATPYACDLAPGDMLFIPYRWWHSMRADGVSMSVSWWWEPSVFTRLRDDARTRFTAPMRWAFRRLRR